MKKKILTVLLSVFSISTCLFALTACEPPHEHSYTTQVVSPTCTEQGYTIYTCECGENYNDDYINALGHNYTKSYTWNGASCIATATCSNNSAHVETETVAGTYVKDADATCTTAENGHYVATFTNSLFATQTTATGSTEVGVALNHNFDAPIYSWDGINCTATRVCLNDSTHVETETVAGVYVKDADATCTTAENGHYQATFANVAFEVQATTTGSEIVGQPLGHNYDEPTYVWDDVNHTCTATRVCLNDSTHVETETVVAEYVKTREPNCNYPERGNYVATFTNQAFKTQKGEKFNTGDALGHSFTNYVSNNDATLDADGTKTAICDRDDCEETDTIVDEGTKLESDVKATFKVNGEEFDINNSIALNSEISIEVLVRGQSTTENVSYKVVKLDNDEAKNYEFAVTNGTFIAGFVGEYTVKVYYLDGETEIPSATYTLTVVANTYENARYISTFSNSESVKAAYTKGEKTTTLEGAEWLSEYQGRYGVISTLGQAYDTDSNYSAFYLRSGDYDTEKQMAAAGLAQTVFGLDEAPEYGGYLLGFNSENWDYLSIPVYVTKPEGVESDTLSIYYVDANAGSDVIENVPYNTWYELKLDKPIIMRTFSYLGRLFRQFSTSNDKNHRNPLLLAANGTVENMYFDSMSFEKYTEFEHFGALYFEDESGNAVTKTETLMMDVANSPATFTIKAKLDKDDTDFLDVSQFKLEYFIYGGSLTRAFKDGSGKSVSYGTSSTFYKDKSAKKTPCTFIATNKVTGDDGYTAFKFVYEHTDGKTYIGYLMIECGFEEVTATE